MQVLAAVGNYFFHLFFHTCVFLKRYVFLLPVGFSFNAIDLALGQRTEGVLEKVMWLQIPM